MEKIKEYQNKIKLLKSEMVRQLIHSNWEPISDNGSNDAFKNEYFIFKFNINKEWKVDMARYYTEDVSKYMPLWKFKFLKWAFVDKKLDNYRKLKEARTASMAADSFFDIHKDLRREARINQVLDK